MENKKVKELKGNHKKLMLVMLKQLLKVSQQVRDIEGTVFDTLIIEAASGEAMDMQRQTKLYGDGVRAAGSNHDLGPPHVW